MILTVNAGSSSIKASLYRVEPAEELVLTGLVDGIHQPMGRYVVKDAAGGIEDSGELPVPDDDAAVRLFMDVFVKRAARSGIRAVGHRFVHGGMKYNTQAFITREMIAELRRVIPFSPLHLPIEISAARELERAHPGLPQVGCFDTAFHRTLPEHARIFALPRKYYEEGLYRYGFHGLSYEYVVEQLQAEGNSSGGRLVIAHLGNGASMAAVSDGRCVDTTMGFTPTAGLVMGTRSGDVDPGLLVYLVREYNMTGDDLNRLLNKEGGLLGISGLSSDMRTLEEQAAAHPAAGLAITVFCYAIRKTIGAYAAALGGLDTLVFTGGIGENAPSVRERILEGLGFLGITIDRQCNASSEPVISSPDSRVQVQVIHTNEELMIARHTHRVVSQMPG